MQRGDGGGEERERRETRYLTDNVIIVSQSTGMREVRRGVAKFPYIWMGALSDGGQREIIIVVLRGRTVLTAARSGRGGKRRGAMEWRDHCGKIRGIERDKDTMENTGDYEYRGYERQRRENKRRER